MKRAIVLLSGGLDSATTLWIAKKHYKPLCLIFDYGQRHKKEVNHAKKIAAEAKCVYKVMKIGLPGKTDSLTNLSKPLPVNRLTKNMGKSIPATYVPARNIIFLSFAVSYAETVNAEAVFIGANAVDFSGYPDCTPGFFRAFNRAIEKGTKSGVNSKSIIIKTPIINKTKAEIIRIGRKLKVPYELTWSCYRGGVKPCGKCDSCLLRAEGFKKAGMKDPAASRSQRTERG